MIIRSTLEPRGPAGAVVLTDEQVAEIGQGAATPPVLVTVNGTTLPMRIGRRGGESLLGFSRAARERAGVEIGEAVELAVVLDAGERTVELPADLAAALAADPEARRAFDALAPSHRKEYARWVGEAKRAETRDRRVRATLAKVRDGAARR
ncbi:MAG: YdeI/OmpD-associated family protein [Solirubrobacteraceae bacterium]